MKSEYLVSHEKQVTLDEQFKQGSEHREQMLFTAKYPATQVRHTGPSVHSAHPGILHSTHWSKSL